MTNWQVPCMGSVCSSTPKFWNGPKKFVGQAATEHPYRPASGGLSVQDCCRACRLCGVCACGGEEGGLQHVTIQCINWSGPEFYDLLGLAKVSKEFP